MMKSIRESTDMRHRTHFRIRMRKLLSGFLAVSTAITMLGGSAATLLAEEPSTEYALAGAGTGKDITIHFGDDEDQSISIHVNSGETTLSQDIAFLPGSELTVAQGASVTLASGKKAYVYDKDEWGAYAVSGLQLVPVGYSTVNGTTAKRTAASLSRFTDDSS